MSKITYMGYVKGSASKTFDTHAEARQWLDRQLDNKPSEVEGWIFESIERVYKPSPPLVSEPLGPQPKFPQLEPEKPDHSYSQAPAMHNGFPADSEGRN